MRKVKNFHYYVLAPMPQPFYSKAVEWATRLPTRRELSANARRQQIARPALAAQNLSPIRRNTNTLITTEDTAATPQQKS